MMCGVRFHPLNRVAVTPENEMTERFKREAEEGLREEFERYKPEVAVPPLWIEGMFRSTPREFDPGGLPPDEPGAKLDGDKTRAYMVLGAFSRALTAVSDVGTFGARKYKAPRNWEMVENKYERYMDALVRHLLAVETSPIDKQSGFPALAHLAWNALAVLEIYLRGAEADGKSESEGTSNMSGAKQ